MDNGLTMKSLTTNSIFYLIYKSLNAIFPFFTGIYVTHVLLSDSIGEVEAARNLAQYFVILAYLGLPTYGLREISKVRKDRKELNKVYSELMIINTLSTFVFLIMYLILVFSVDSYRNNLILYLITGGSIALNFFNNSWLFEGLEEFRYVSIRNIAFKVISFVLLLLFVKKQSDYLIYALITICGTAGNYLLNIINTHKYVSLIFSDLNLLRHMKSIFFLVAVNLAIEIYSLVDVTMLSNMAQYKNVAFYTYGQKVQKILIQIINSFTMVLVPRISLYYKEKRYNEFNDSITKTLQAILLLSLPIIVGICFTSRYLLCEIYGDEYINSAYVLDILSFIIVISPVGYLLGSRALLVSGNEQKMIIPVGIGAIINVIGNYILIREYSEIGAALASLISESIIMIIYVSMGKKYLTLKKAALKNTALHILGSLLCMTIWLIACVLIIKSNLICTITQIIGSVFIYFIILFIFKEQMVLLMINRILKRR